MIRDVIVPIMASLEWFVRLTLSLVSQDNMPPSIVYLIMHIVIPRNFTIIVVKLPIYMITYLLTSYINSLCCICICIVCVQIWNDIVAWWHYLSQQNILVWQFVYDHIPYPTLVSTWNCLDSNIASMICANNLCDGIRNPFRDYDYETTIITVTS